jgi:hypothetical protein
MCYVNASNGYQLRYLRTAWNSVVCSSAYDVSNPKGSQITEITPIKSPMGMGRIVRTFSVRVINCLCVTGV